MTIIFRVDVNQSLGTGHFYRCFSLAIALREHNIIFLGNIQSESLRSQVAREGFKLIERPNNIDYKIDMQLTLDAISSLGATSLVVDIPHLSPEWEYAISLLTITFVLFVDRPSRPHVAPVIISPNLFQSLNPFKDYVPETTEVLVGPSYLAYRPEFYENNPPRSHRGEIRTISSFFGGSDPGFQSKLILELAKTREFSSISFTILAGPINPRYDQLVYEAKDFPNIEILRSTQSIARFFRDSDLSVGSYGTSAWERCLMGTPSICTIQSEDQFDDAVELEKSGAAINLGYSINIKFTIQKCVLGLLSDTYKLRDMSEKATLVMSKQRENSQFTLSKILGY